MPSDCSFFTGLNLTAKEIYNQAQHEIHSGIWVYDCTAKEYWWSDQTYQIYGVKRGTPITDELFTNQIHEDDQVEARAAFHNIANEKTFHFAHRIKAKGTVKWLEHNGRLYSGKKYPHPYILGTVQDVTKVKHQEERLAAKRANLDAIAEYLSETIDAGSLVEFVSILNRVIEKRIDMVLAAFFIRQGEQVSRIIPQNTDPVQAFFFQNIQDFVGYKTVCTGQQQNCPISNYPTDLGKQVLKNLGGGYVTAFPVKHKGTTIGALSIATRCPDGLTHDEEGLCRTLCGYLAVQLNNAFLHAQLKQELQLRTRMESDRDIIFNESVDFISIIDSNGCFAQINPAFAQRLGYSPEALVGRSVFEFVHPDDRPYARRVFGNLPYDGVSRGFRNRFICRGGEIGHLENNLKYMPETGNTIAVSRDLTGMKETEERNLLLEQKVVFERSKTEFFSGLSHEFKTPLNIILSSLDLVRLKSCKEDNERFQNEYAKFFNYAYRSCYKLLRLSSNLIDTSKLENGFYQLNVTLVWLDNLLQNIVDAAAAYANSKNIELEFNSTVGRKVWLPCDEDAVERILLNLLSNAIKNSRQSGKISVVLKEEGDFYRISVEDNGTGVPEELLPQIFDKFVTNPNLVSGKREGSGIGLSLVKLFTELHDGTVSAESQPGSGSRFSFTISKNLKVNNDAGYSPKEAVAVMAKMELSEVT